MAVYVTDEELRQRVKHLEEERDFDLTRYLALVRDLHALAKTCPEVAAFLDTRAKRNGGA